MLARCHERSQFMTNPYIKQVCMQTGMTESEVRASARPATINIDVARRSGFDSVQEYEEALWDFLNGM